MDLLKTKRIPLRSAFTKTFNVLKEKLEDADASKSDIEVAFEQLVSKADRLREADEKILEEMLKNKATEKEYTQEFDACEIYIEKVVTMKMEVKQKFEKKEDSQKVQRNELPVLDVSARMPNGGMKLPKINLIQFDGDPRHWLNWWNTFLKIHEDVSLDLHSKFVYLIQSTEANSKAREIVTSFPTTGDNYEKVIEHLQNRFGRQDILIQVYVRDLLQLVLQNYTANKKPFELSSLYDKLETKLRALESLGVAREKYDNILFPLVESSLPQDTLRIWQREREKSQKIGGKSDLDSLLDFLKTEVITEERMSLARDNFGLSKPKKCFKNNDLNDCNVATCNELWIGEVSKSSPIKPKSGDICLVCDKSHPTEKCFKAKMLSYEEKKDLLVKKGVCFLCFKTTHIARNCKKKAKCAICGQTRHVSFLCNRQNLVKENSNSASYETNKSTSQNSDTAVIAFSSLNQSVLLQTLIVRLRHGKKEIKVRAIYDSGSERSYVTNDVVQFLDLECLEKKKLVYKLFSGIETAEKDHNVYKINVSSLNNDYSCDMICLDESVICSNVQQIPVGSWLAELNVLNIHVTDIQGQMPDVFSEIKLLIGADVAGQLFTGKVKTLRSGPVALLTKLGWVLMGQIPKQNSCRKNNTLACVSLHLNERSAENFWRLDTLGITDPIESKTKLEIQEETMFYFKTNLRINSESRYEIALPWVLESSRLPSNRELAEKRLDSTWRKLSNTNKIDVYQEVFDDWASDKIIESVGNEKACNEHYLPHRPVFKESSMTTKVRPVFDASSHSKGTVSLNDCLEKGPNLIEIIPSLINRFRKFQVGVVSDIEKAFLQISIREKDRDFLRFLWKGVDGKEIKIYRHRRVVFGLNCSPFLLAATLSCHLDNVGGDFSKTAEILKESFYVDNCLTSFETIEELDEFVMLSRILLSEGKFNLRDWRSNGESKVFSQTELEESISVLGLDWNLKNDTLSCKIEADTVGNMIASKRLLLSYTNKLFDPMGFTSPVTLFPKLALQECWKLKLNWDENLPEHLEKQFNLWRTKMILLKEIKIPRWMNFVISKQNDISLHVFCDASKHAYATCIFLRVQTGEHVSVNFVQARTRVSPLKNVTIPRLELLACTIGARLGDAVASDLNIHGLRRFYWSDSTTALSWIQRDARWGTFVWNRVQEIRTLTKIEDWRHVPSELNSADLPSRGCSVEHFCRSKWWEGPNWLREPETQWPCGAVMPDEDVVCSEMRKTVLAAHEKSSEPNDWYYRYFSSFPKILRLVAWMLRFVNNSRKIEVIKETELSFSELQRAERTLIILIQRESFDLRDVEKFKTLGTIVDEHGILRVKTPVMHRKDTEDFKFPVLLPSEHPVVQRLIFWRHVELLHAGVAQLMSNLRERFWIIKARKTIRTVVHRCVRCKRFSASKTESVPIPLPADRVDDVAVFQVTGVDLAGPLYLKKGRKSWIVLYTCAVYRAVHLELVTSLSTESFLQSFRRFIARRGRPNTVYSDNGTNFVGANSELSAIDWEHVSSVTALQRINWKFNPPSAAWWGGFFERLIQLVKRILRKVLGRAVLSYEELSTILCDCEQVINSRPLTYVSEDTEDLSPLTPTMFLQPLQSSDVADIDLVDSQGYNNRLRYVQKIREHLRKRFRIEYLGQLKQQMSVPRNVKPLSVNDVVLLESDQKRAQWALARIVELYPGKDGHHRVARVKTKTGEFTRPVQRLYNLEVKRDSTSEPIVRTRSGRQVLSPKRLSY